MQCFKFMYNWQKEIVPAFLLALFLQKLFTDFSTN